MIACRPDRSGRPAQRVNRLEEDIYVFGKKRSFLIALISAQEYMYHIHSYFISFHPLFPDPSIIPFPFLLFF